MMATKELIRKNVCTITSAVVAVCLCIVAPVMAETIHVVDMQQVLEGSIIGKAAKNDLEAEARRKEMDLDAKRQSLLKERSELEKQKGILAPAALSDRMEVLNRRQRDLADQVEATKDQMARRSRAELKRVMQEVDLVIKDLTQSGKYQMILAKDERAVVYNKPELDLTAEVIKKLNEKKLAN